MKLLVKGPVFKAVNGLWLSGLYGTLLGSVAGVVCGAVVGFVIMVGMALVGRDFSTLPWALVGALVGGLYGFFVGAIVGLPAGILSSGIGERLGCRIGTAIAAFLVGSGIAYFPLAAMLVHPNDGAGRWMELLIILAVLVFTVVSYWVGNAMYTRLENSEGIFTRWRWALQESGLDEQGFKDSAIALGIAITPVVFTYGYVLASFALGRLLF